MARQSYPTLPDETLTTYLPSQGNRCTRAQDNTTTFPTEAGPRCIFELKRGGHCLHTLILRTCPRRVRDAESWETADEAGVRRKFCMTGLPIEFSRRKWRALPQQREKENAEAEMLKSRGPTQQTRCSPETNTFVCEDHHTHHRRTVASGRRGHRHSFGLDLDRRIRRRLLVLPVRGCCQ